MATEKIVYPKIGIIDEVEVEDESTEDTEQKEAEAEEQ